MSLRNREFFDLRGRIAVVTGASRGIGRAAAVALAGAGARVVLVGRDAVALEASAAQVAEAAGAAGAASGEGREAAGLCLTADLTDPESVVRVFQQTVEAWGGLDILVNNAGVGLGRRFVDSTLEDWDRTHAINLRAAYLCAQQAVAVMRKGGAEGTGGGGKIINVISASALVGMPGLSVYGAAKGGLLSLTRALAVELARDGICVNAVCPGYIATDMSREFLESESGARFIQANVPLRRPGDPRDVAAAILFFASPASDYVTGVVLPVDGGQTAK